MVSRKSYSKPSVVWYEGQDKTSFEKVLASHTDSAVLDQLQNILNKRKSELYRELLKTSDPYVVQNVLGQLTCLEETLDLFKWRGSQ